MERKDLVTKQKPDDHDSTGLFSVMAAFPSGVAIVTTTDFAGRPVGLTITALCSVSAKPPLVLICVGEHSRTLPHLRRRGRFVVHIMGDADAGHMCWRFASSATDKFEGVAWRYTDSGIPLLERNVAAWTECRTETEVRAGDHTVIFGRYVAGVRNASGSQPLMYYDRAYRKIP